MRSAPGEGSSAQVVGNWEPAWSAQHQKWFYQDRKAGKSSWSRPQGCTVQLPTEPPQSKDSAAMVTQEQARQAKDGLPPGWECEYDQTHRRFYYFNRKTCERSWNKPGGGGRASALNTASRPSNGGAAAAATGRGNQLGADPRDRQAPQDRSASPAAARAGEPFDRSAWDPDPFLQRLKQARAQDWRAVKGVLRDVSESNYRLRNRWRVPRTIGCSSQQVRSANADLKQMDTQVTFSSMTTGDACVHFCRENRFVVALNFANGKDVGGGYKNGASAQEEDLCRRFPCLYTSLNNAARDRLYPFGPPTCTSPSQPAKYSEVLWTTEVTLGRQGEDQGFALLPPEQQVSVAMVAAAAPNLRFAKPPDVNDTELMYETVRNIFLVPRLMMERSQQAMTLILGAWGCGAFGGDPQQVSELFLRALQDPELGRLYQEVHFAIPCIGGGPESARNYEVFRETFRRANFRFTDL